MTKDICHGITGVIWGHVKVPWQLVKVSTDAGCDCISASAFEFLYTSDFCGIFFHCNLFCLGEAKQ